ncbi:MAG: hypothetical protein KDD83_05325 [Caldilineaceae bacterium]|nr:hypothetical protein [Caldilineaceae bacterium]
MRETTAQPCAPARVFCYNFAMSAIDVPSPAFDIDEFRQELRAGKSLLTRAILRLYRLPRWFLAVGAVLLLTLPFLMLLVHGDLGSVLATGLWRLLLEPSIILYILILIPIMERSQWSIITHMRPIVALDDAAYARAILDADRPNNRAELIAFCGGMAFGLFAEPPRLWQSEFWFLYPYALLTSMLMFGLLAWVIAGSLVGTRLSSALLRRPLSVDIFDLAPFEPIGRQSLMLSFSFVVGTTISLLFASSFADFLTVPNLIVYSVLVTVTVLVFFLNMRHTHRVLAQVKAEEQDDAAQNISRLYRRLQEAARAGRDDPDAAAELAAWLGMEQRLKLARTWPYNTEMLRALTVSVLTPVAVGASRVIIALLQR